MKIELPEGFQMPENMREGEGFDAVVTLEPYEGGGFYITAVNGSPMPKMDKEDMKDKKSEDSDEMEEEVVEEEVVADPEIRLPFGPDAG